MFCLDGGKIKGGVRDGGLWEAPVRGSGGVEGGNTMRRGKKRAEEGIKIGLCEYMEVLWVWSLRPGRAAARYKVWNS